MIFSGINDGGDLPSQLLIDAYNSIKNTPFEIPEDDTQDFTITFYNPDKRGYLVKVRFVSLFVFYFCLFVAHIQYPVPCIHFNFLTFLFLVVIN